MPPSSTSDRLPRAATVARRCFQAVLLLSPVLLLVACARQSEYGYAPGSAAIGESPSLAPSHYYPPPGPPEDPWGPYIREAATRYRVPEQWVRAVMHQESGGEEQAVSPVGAMGLMQVMPETYEGLRQRYGLGDDPYDPHNNVLAGTAYIREMYDRYGAPGFLAAYNAGPDRVDLYLAGSANLPDETVNYLAAITPNLGNAVPLSGPLARYAYARLGRGIRTSPSVASLAAGCDLNRAYDPNHPCTTLERAAAASAPLQLAFAPQTGANGCDLNVAYDPSHPCTSAEQMAATSAPPQPAPAQPAPAQPAPAQPAPVQLALVQPALVQPALVQPALVQPALVQQAAVQGCDMNVAYDPSRPCTSAGRAVTASAPPNPALVREAAAGGCDPDVAFDPDRPCDAATAAPFGLSPPVGARPLPAATSFPRYPSVTTTPNPPMRLAMAGGTGQHLLAIPTRDWAIQVGAFANPGLARAVAEGARAQAPDQLRSAALALPPTPNGGSVLYRARLVHLSASAASNACWRLNQRQLPCVVVQPNRS
jgi:D-alanyl-D-alanine carboxypeptidase